MTWLIAGLASAGLYGACLARHKAQGRAILRKVGHVWIVDADGTAQRLRDKFTLPGDGGSAL